MARQPEATQVPGLKYEVALSVAYRAGLDGTVITYAETSRMDNVVATSLKTLVNDALELFSNEDDAADLPKLEAALESALARMRGFRQERAP